MGGDAPWSRSGQLLEQQTRVRSTDVGGSLQHELRGVRDDGELQCDAVYGTPKCIQTRLHEPLYMLKLRAEDPKESMLLYVK